MITYTQRNAVFYSLNRILKKHGLDLIYSDCVNSWNYKVCLVVVQKTIPRLSPFSSFWVQDRITFPLLLEAGLQSYDLFGQ